MEQTTLVWGIMIVQIVCEKQPTKMSDIKTFLIKPIKKTLILEKTNIKRRTNIVLFCCFDKKLL